MEKELKIEIPVGYEIDKEQSTFERIVFKKKEDKLPQSWEEFCDITPWIGWRITDNGYIKYTEPSHPFPHHDAIRDEPGMETKEDAEAHLALMKLHKLRNCYRQGWVPKMGNVGFSIKVDYLDVAEIGSLPRFLSFPSKEIALKFLHNFLDLILTAKELLR